MGYQKTNENALFIDFIKKGYTQSEAARIVGVSTRTAGTWARAYRKSIEPDAFVAEVKSLIYSLEIDLQRLKNLIQDKYT